LPAPDAMYRVVDRHGAVSRPDVYAALRTVPARGKAYASPVTGSYVSVRPVGDAA